MSGLAALEDYDHFLSRFQAAQKWQKPTDQKGNYDLHYGCLEKWFSSQTSLGWTSNAVVQGSLMIYGWMPTILEGRRSHSLMTSASALEFAGWLNTEKTDDFLEFPNLKFVNESYVGTSKFLHFWRPTKYAIWDSNVFCAFFDDEPKPENLPRSKIENKGNILKYLTFINKLVDNEEAACLRDAEKCLFHFGRGRRE